MEYRSDIRESTINELLSKVAQRNYNQYLFKMNINKARGIDDQIISFDFPVTALVGPNGGGKSTILGAAAIAYKDIAPRLFFAKSGNIDNSMVNWKIEYEIVDKALKHKDTVKRSASYKSRRWKRTAIDRPIVFYGVSRTVPASERKELLRCASSSYKPKEIDIKSIGDQVSASVAKILDKDIRGFQSIRVDDKGRVTLLSGTTGNGIKYSEFHFGAGESSVIRMIMDIESQPENLIILIEEIENGLHPVATQKMVEYLIELGVRKRAQTIFTTHSNDALGPLPPKAVWVAVDGHLVQGKPDIHSLRVIKGHTEKELIVFTEDSFSAEWMRYILRIFGNIAVDCVGVYPMKGDCMAVKVHEMHNINPSITKPSVCYIDGDSQQNESRERKIFRLPGEIPEQYIFDSVLEKLDDCIAKLTAALLQDISKQSEVSAILSAVQRANPDPHLLFSKVGEKLDLLSEARVVEAFLAIWCQTHREQVEQILEPIKQFLPLEKVQS